MPEKGKLQETPGEKVMYYNVENVNENISQKNRSGNLNLLIYRQDSTQKNLFKNLNNQQ